MKRIFKILPFLALLMAGLISCEKEYSEENGGTVNGGGTQGGTAVFALAGAPGGCTTPSITGTYKAGTALTSAEKVTLIVDVTTPGTYTITTGTANGISFSGAGTFTATGQQFIELTATGSTPTSAGTFTYVPGTAGCSFSLTFTAGGTSSGSSVFTFAGAPNDCTTPVVSGVYTEGVALTATNTIKLSINVTTVGTYNVTTGTANGIKFSAAGTFTTTGAQDLILTGSGTPESQGVISYSAGTNGCSFNITFAAPAPAAFTLDGAPNTCAGFTLAGTYMAGVATTAANTVSLKVNVTTIGAYTITTNTANGITFSKTGNFTTTGVNTVVLTASGTPTAGGTNTFSPQGLASTCTFSVVTAAAPSPAVYTLAGAPASCTAPTIAGTYAATTALGANNTVTISVNVASVGTYTLSTNTVNGMTFSATGLFTTTGPQTVVLKGTGTPAAAQTSTFTPQIGTSSCTFDIVVAAAPAAPAGIFTCKINGVFTAFNEDAHAEVTYNLGGTTETFLSIGGRLLPLGSTTDNFNLYISKGAGGTIPTGTYNQNTFMNGGGVYQVSMSYYIDATQTYWAVADNTPFTPNPAFTITITSITATRYKGTFSGTVKENFGQGTGTKTITEGTFDVPIQ